MLKQDYISFDDWQKEWGALFTETIAMVWTLIGS
jgi:hypothetical protein